jgi:hypothetical protein
MKYVVSISGGLTSFEAWRRCLEKHGPENTIPIFADVGVVRENGRIVSGEDEDLYRFLDETEAFLGQKIIRLQSEKYKDVWGSFFGERFMGNSRIDTCSKFLKREVIRSWIAKNHPDCIWVLGYTWLERHRIEKFRSRIPNCWFPCDESPFVISEEIAEWLEERGIRRPAMYVEGFLHNNCGGFCVKGGIGQLWMLWKHRLDRYLYNEGQEERFREEISPVTIFKKGERPITMRALRALFEGGWVPGSATNHGCGGGCFIPEQLTLL